MLHLRRQYNRRPEPRGFLIPEATSSGSHAKCRETNTSLAGSGEISPQRRQASDFLAILPMPDLVFDARRGRVHVELLSEISHIEVAAEGRGMRIKRFLRER